MLVFGTELPTFYYKFTLFLLLLKSSTYKNYTICIIVHIIVEVTIKQFLTFHFVRGFFYLKKQQIKIMFGEEKIELNIIFLIYGVRSMT